MASRDAKVLQCTQQPGPKKREHTEGQCHPPSWSRSGLWLSSHHRSFKARTAPIPLRCFLQRLGVNALLRSQGNKTFAICVLLLLSHWRFSNKAFLLALNFCNALQTWWTCVAPSQLYLSSSFSLPSQNLRSFGGPQPSEMLSKLISQDGPMRTGARHRIILSRKSFLQSRIKFSKRVLGPWSNQ